MGSEMCIRDRDDNCDVIHVSVGYNGELQNEKAGEAQKKTITGHISGPVTTHELTNVPWPDIGQLLNNFEKGHTRRMIDLNGVVPKRRPPQ